MIIRVGKTRDILTLPHLHRRPCRITRQGAFCTVAATPCLSPWERWLALGRDGEGLRVHANFGSAGEKSGCGRRGRRSLQRVFGGAGGKIGLRQPLPLPMGEVARPWARRRGLARAREFRKCGGKIGLRTVGDAGPYNAFSEVREGKLGCGNPLPLPMGEVARP